MTNGTEYYKVKITEAVFKVCCVKVANAVLLAQNDVLKIAPAMYPFWKSNIKTFFIPKGEAGFSKDDIFHGLIPSKLIVGMVKSEAYSGSFALNPFNFVNERVSSVEFAINGSSVPAEALEPNFSTGDTVTSFLTLFYNKYPHHKGNFITREDYGNGYSLFVFDIDGQADEKLMVTTREGLSRVSLRFSKNLTQNISLIVYGIFPKTLYCDYSRSIWWS